MTCITYAWHQVITQCTHPNSDLYHCAAINFHFVPDGDEDEDEIVDDDALSQPREEPASLEDLPSDQFDMPKRETSV